MFLAAVASMGHVSSGVECSTPVISWWKVMEPLGGGALRDEVGRWVWALGFVTQLHFLFTVSFLSVDAG